MKQAEMTKTKMQKLASEIAKTRARLDQLTQQVADLRLVELRKVKIVKNKQSITLLYDGRQINARKNRYGRYLVKEGSKILDNDYFGNIHDLRFVLATGQV